MAKVSSENVARIDGYVDKYMELLKIPGDPPPIKIRSEPERRPGRISLARITGTLQPGHPHELTLELQKTLLKNDRALERTIAHELVHYRDLTALSDDDIVAFDTGEKPWPDKHGETFLEGAERINAVMGAGFVQEFGTDEETEALGLRSPKRDQRRHEPVVTKFMVGVALLGVLGGIAVRQLRSKRERLSPRRPSSASMPTRTNERGRYESPRPSSAVVRTRPARANERGHYGKNDR